MNRLNPAEALRLESKERDIRLVQGFLNYKAGYDVAVDGVLGCQTIRAAGIWFKQNWPLGQQGPDGWNYPVAANGGVTAFSYDVIESEAKKWAEKNPTIKEEILKKSNQ